MGQSNQNSFDIEELQRLLKEWQHDFVMKQHEGEVRGMDMIRTYPINQSNAEESHNFILKLIRHYKFITFVKEEKTLSMTISVRPSTIKDFLNFCPVLEHEEERLIAKAK